MESIRVYASMVILILAHNLPLAQAKMGVKSVELLTIETSIPTSYGELKAEIHFDERDHAVALRAKEIIEKDLIKVVNYFEYVPQNLVHFNVDPYIRLTNGNARVFPTNIINLYNYPPNNSEHLVVMEDWLRGLIVHEFIHISHLDQTADWTELARKLFGSIAKIPAGVVPRWFAEGIATWGESHLLSDSGRLNNPLFKKELLVQFLNEDFCKTIDCLDEPGVYPRGQLSYWAGSQFLEYVENKKQGSIKCMVKTNAAKIPFLLNAVFESCTGKNTIENFSDFREQLINSVKDSRSVSEILGERLTNAFGSDNFQAGLILDGNILYKVEQNKKNEALVSYDLEDNVHMVKSKFSFPISDLAGVTTMSLEKDEEVAKYLIVSFSEDPDFREGNRTWKLVNAETLLEEIILPFLHDPSYVIGLGDNLFLTASFFNNQWIIEKQRYDQSSRKMFAPELLHSFDLSTNLTFFQKKGQRIFLKFNMSSEKNVLAVSDLNLENVFKIYESKNYYDIPLLNESFVITREKKEGVDTYSMFELDGSLKTVRTNLLHKEQFDQITKIYLEEGRAVVLENSLKSKKITQADVISYLKKNRTFQSSSDLIPVNFSNIENAQNISKDNSSVTEFPKWYHFKPHYWFFASSTSENISSLGAMTTFSDPMDITTLSASLYTFPSISKVGGNLELLHKFSSVTDLLSLRGFFDRDFSKSDVSSVISETREGHVGVNYSLLMKRWSLTPGVYFSGKSANDFLSDTSTKSVGISNVIFYQSLSFDDTFQSLLAQARIQKDEPSLGESFFNARLKLQSQWRFSERFDLGIKASWGKLYKSNFNQGVIYGGGINNLSNMRWHEFYGVPYGNSYGNEIFTSRIYADYNLLNIYRGHGFVPVFLKELHLLFGTEVLSADRIFLDKRLLRNKTLQGYFIGPKIKTNLFYFVPADIDVIFSSVKNPSGGNVNEVQLNINSEMF